MNHEGEPINKVKLEQYLTPVSVWALSFGCAVGWGAFVMPGTTFLPKAGPLGTAIGIIVGAIIMFVIGVNYNYLMTKYHDAGGTLTYTINNFGYDHGFMSSWFLILVYIAIIWANASAIGLISKYLFGDMIHFGFHYQVLGYEVCFGEVLISLIAIYLCGIVCVIRKKLAAALQIVFAVVLFVGVLICSLYALKTGDVSFSDRIQPFYSSNDQGSFRQIGTIIALSPWAFVGFESVSNSTAGFNFKISNTIWIMLFALIAGAISYILLTFLAVSYVPEGFGSWNEYVASLSSFDGLEGLPTFYSVSRALGQKGIVVLGAAAFAGIATGLIGNIIAASRLMYKMSQNGIIPKWFGRLNNDAVPSNAIYFLMAISVVIPFLGRTAIGWIVDVNTVGAIIAYIYTSACAISAAKKDNNKKIFATGALGIAFSVFCFAYFMSWSAKAMSTESYLILAGWSILGFIYFRHVFAYDEDKKFGKSIVVWIVLLFLIFFTTLMWVKQATDDITESMAQNISEYYESKNSNNDPQVIAETEIYLRNQLQEADDKITRNNIIQMIFLMSALGIMFSVYSLMNTREKAIEAERVKAIEQNKAKSIFLSNMSHDIRTPMNAIIGYINLSERDDITIDELKDYIEKIKGSSHHLLALINDVLEMSRIESGKIDLEPIPISLVDVFDEVRDMFQTQMDQKGIDYVVSTAGINYGYVYCDKNRLNRVLLNLISNAYKFTPQGGNINVSVWQLASEDNEYGRYEIRVKDSGMGMSKEFAANVFNAFERERTVTEQNIEGTGLGMTITKNIIDMMGGEISVNTAVGMGTEFVIILKLKLQSEDEVRENNKDAGIAEDKKETEAIDLFGKRILLVDDVDVNREIASKILTSMGFVVEKAENGKEAADKVATSQTGYYDLVLMDVQMPVMGGYEATALIRRLDNKELANIPIIAMTANAFAEDIENARKAGMNGHIAKPIDLAQMKKTIEEALNH